MLRLDYGAASVLLKKLRAEQPVVLEAELVWANMLRDSNRDAAAREAYSALAESKDARQAARALRGLALLERRAGRLDVALEHARKARKLFDTAADYGGLVGTDYLLGDLYLLHRDLENATEHFERASVRARQVGRALGSEAGRYALRAGLCMVQLKRGKAALEQIQFALKAARAVADRGLEAAALSALALYHAYNKEPMEALDQNRAAIELAKREGDALNGAIAWTNHARIEPGTALYSVEQALALLDSRRDDAGDARAALEGENPWIAPSLGLVALLDARGDAAQHAATALHYLQRLRSAETLVALRGRDAALLAMLSTEIHANYRNMRAALFEVRSLGIADCETKSAWTALVDYVQGSEPDAARLAFPQRASLADVQAALKPNEALLVLRQDQFAHVRLFVTKTAAALSALDKDDPLKGLAGALDGVKRLIVVPDGGWAARPFALAPFDGGIAFDRFDIYYMPSVGGLVRWRQRDAAPSGSLSMLSGKTQAYEMLPRSASEGVGATLFLMPKGREMGRAAQRMALAEAVSLRGPTFALFSTSDEKPKAFWKPLFEGEARELPARLFAAQKKLRAAAETADPANWAGFFCYGLPD